MHLLFSLLLAFIISSCGEEPVTDPAGGNVRVNQNVVFDEDDMLTDTEKTALSITCNALLSKEQYFDRSIVNRGQTLQFRLRRTNCGGVYLSDKNFQSDVTSSRSGFELTNIPEGGFKDIITSNSTMLKEFCNLSTTSANVQRAERYGQNATWLKLVKGGAAGCSERKDQACLVLGTGTQTQEENTYKIYSIETLKIRVNDSSLSHGVVTERSLESSQLCSSDNVTSTVQTSLSF